MNILELGETFKKARLGQRLTQQEVANLACVSVSTISRFERGELLDFGILCLFNLFRVVGLDLVARPHGHQRTLDDIQREKAAARQPVAAAVSGQRVKHRRRDA